MRIEEGILLNHQNAQWGSSGYLASGFPTQQFRFFVLLSLLVCAFLVWYGALRLVSCTCLCVRRDGICMSPLSVAAVEARIRSYRRVILRVETSLSLHVIGERTTAFFPLERFSVTDNPTMGHAFD